MTAAGGVSLTRSASAASDDLFDSYRWKASQFNSYTPDENGALLVHNSLQGALYRVAVEDRAAVERVATHGVEGLPGGVLAELALLGLIVPDTLDEQAAASELHQSRALHTDQLELILMPNENCNFRCVYCYESFARGKMLPSVVAGIKALVGSVAPTLSKLQIGWFGGEPLTAIDIVTDISAELRRICADHEVGYSSSMVTNGYLLSADVVAALFRADVRQFQITLDGPAEDHDRLRILAGGRDRGGTHATILRNLVALRDRDDDFLVVVRVNFDPSMRVERMKRFVRTLHARLSGDPRFVMDFHPVGRWGGGNDANIEVCDPQDGYFLQTAYTEAAHESGFDLKPLRQRMKPFGSVCYAANPRSFVIGSDVVIYKCTVAFEDERNRVGTLEADGTLTLDPTKMALWTQSGEETDMTCQACSFRPACQGNACPWARIRTGGTRPCPSTKTNHAAVVRLLAKETTRWHAKHAAR